MHGLECIVWDMDLIEGSEISFQGICLFVSRLLIVESWETFWVQGKLSLPKGKDRGWARSSRPSEGGREE